MRNAVYFILALFTITTACSTKKEATTTEVIQYGKENIFISFERTPCLGKCPDFKAVIYNDGHVKYEGRNFVEKKGKYTAKITQEQIDFLKKTAHEIDIFSMKTKYDQPVTDVPSVFLTINIEDNSISILDRFEGPKSLRKFEELIDKIVLESNLVKTEDDE